MPYLTKDLIMKKRIGTQTLLAGCLTLVSLLSAPVQARVSPDEAARVGLTGTELTPLGAIRAGNADGTIPAWTGGITKPPAGYTDGDWYVDPFADDQVLFTINAQNYQQYADKLTPGTIALLKKYPDTFHLNVYPTRRSASYPDWFYQNSVWNTAHTHFCDQSLGKDREERCLDASSFRPGVAFPIPRTGGEAMWNHTFFFFGKHHVWRGYGFNAYDDGSYAEHVKIDRSIYVYYMNENEKPKQAFFNRDGGAGWCFSQEDVAPPRTAGQIFGGCNFMQTVDFDAYIYIPGQRRVRKAPEIGFYDSPGTGSDGLRTADQRFIFAMTGNEEWYQWEPPVRKEIYIPYNSYKAASPTLDDFDKIVVPGHVNSDIKRYELHRVWVLEGKLKPGYRHLMPHRVVYVDEDSWAAALGDHYDSKGELWRVSEAYLMNFYNVPMVSWWGDDHVDLRSSRHVGINAWYNVGVNDGGGPPDFKNMPDPAIMTPAGLRKFGVR